MCNFEYNNKCLICGEPIEDFYIYCYSCAFDACPKCGGSKKREYELCWECNQKEKIRIKKEKNMFSICPLCGEIFYFSDYLETAIEDNKTRLIANLVTHYRHEHQKSWDSQWRYISMWKKAETYYIAKKDHNNRAKRQIMRKCKDWLKENDITAKNFFDLQDNDEKTIELVNKTFGL